MIELPTMIWQRTMPARRFVRVKKAGLLSRWGTAWPLLLLCSCQTPPPSSTIVPAHELPPEMSMNKDAGRGNWLFVTVRLGSGEELPFFVDTGATVTCFDKSLESKLGEPVGIGKLQHYGELAEAGIYPAPRFFLGGVPLITASKVITVDFTKGSSDAGRPVMGVLGQDCLQHYCIQLDFQTGKIRFLDPDHLNTAQLGQAFALTSLGKKGDIRPLINFESFLGTKAVNLIIDTGNAHDGDFELGIFQREVQKHILRVEPEVTGHQSDRAWLPECVWSGQTYTNLLIGSGVNSLGLRFLARHLVTLNFPKRTMYLKWESSGPLRHADIGPGGTGEVEQPP